MKDLGGGYSAPSVAAGRVFGMSNRGNDEVVWALDEKDGKEVWVARLGAAAGADAAAARGRVELVDEDDRRRVGAHLREKVADAGGAEAVSRSRSKRKRRLAERLGNDPEKLAAAEEIIARAKRMSPD